MDLGGITAARIAYNVSPHWFRHSHASYALDRGDSVALVRDTLGHSCSLAVTSRHAHANLDSGSKQCITLGNLVITPMVYQINRLLQRGRTDQEAIITLQSDALRDSR